MTKMYRNCVKFTLINIFFFFIIGNPEKKRKNFIVLIHAKAHINTLFMLHNIKKRGYPL